MAKKLIISDVEGNRCRGRPRLEWMDGVRMSLGERDMSVKQNRLITLSGRIWELIVRSEHRLDEVCLYVLSSCGGVYNTSTPLLPLFQFPPYFLQLLLLPPSFLLFPCRLSLLPFLLLVFPLLLLSSVWALQLQLFLGLSLHLSPFPLPLSLQCRLLFLHCFFLCSL